MKALHSRGWLVALCLLPTLSLAVTRAQTGTSVDAAFEQFWRARNPAEAAQAATAVVESGVGLDEALERLERGRPYAADVPRGVIPRSRQTDTLEFPYTIEIPNNYDPSRRYQVRVHLHGGVSRPTATRRRGSGSIGALSGVEQIYVMPVAWNDAPWWSHLQIENLNAILDDLKRTYNVDENRVVLSGVSDGGTAAYYFAMRDTTPYASFLPLNGAPGVLRTPMLGLDDLWPNNLLNKPFFAVNGALDRLYPADRVAQDVGHLQRGGVDLTFLPRADGEHNTAWWPEVKDTFEAFVAEHPRDPIPATLTWSASASDTSQPRAHWVMIDSLAPPEPEPLLPDLNLIGQLLVRSFGVRAMGARVAAVTRPSNAERFGLLAGDLVLAINGRALPSGVDLVDALAVNELDTELTLSVERGDEILELQGVYLPDIVPAARRLFVSERQAGRADVTREGNTIRARTHAVGALIFLLSPEVFDLSQPVTVEVNDRVVFEDRVSPSLSTLMKWAARDNDRTMLFPAELRIEVPQ